MKKWIKLKPFSINILLFTGIMAETAKADMHSRKSTKIILLSWMRAVEVQLFVLEIMPFMKWRSVQYDENHGF